MRYVEDLIAAIKHRRSEIGESIAEGHASSFEAYQRLVGQRLGLREALDILDNLLKEDELNER